jgi:hypothetical protein
MLPACAIFIEAIADAGSNPFAIDFLLDLMGPLPVTPGLSGSVKAMLGESELPGLEFEGWPPVFARDDPLSDGESR